MGQSIQSIQDNDAILLIGSNIRLEQPMLAHRMRKASLQGCNIVAINSQEYDFYFTNQSTWNLAPQNWINALAEIVKCSGEINSSELPNALHQIIDQASCSDHAQDIFNLLNKTENSSVFIGSIAESHPQASKLRALGNLLAKLTNSKFGMLAKSGNTAGAWLSGIVPHRLPAGKESTNVGMTAMEMLEKSRKSLVLFNLEPELDCADAALAMNALQAADEVIVFTPFITEQIKHYASVILPIATFAETEGTYVNNEGRWQSVNNVVNPPEESRSSWRVLRVLANKLGFEEFQYHSSEEIRDEMKALLAQQASFDSNLKNLNQLTKTETNGGLYRVSSIPMYAVDNVVRRAESLQETMHEQEPFVSMCKRQADELDIFGQEKVCVRQAGRESTLPLQIDESLPMQCVWIQKSAKEIDSLGNSIASVEIKRITDA